MADIHDAVRAGDLGRVQALLAADPSVASAREGDGVSAVLLARYQWKLDALAALLAAEPELDVFEAAAIGRPERVRELVDADPTLVRAQAQDGFHPLALAAFFGHEEIVRDLLDRDADAAQWTRHETIRVQPLHAAAANGSVDIARLLLDGGAPVDTPQPNGFTALHAAAFHGNTALALLLLERGAERAARTDEGKTPADIAAARGHGELAAVLEPDLGD
jgi:ankyrin repeat protein